MRIQIMPLPSVMVGDDAEEPFALIVDQCESGLLAPQDSATWQRFANQIGARAAFVVPYSVEIVDRYATEVANSPADPLDERIDAQRQEIARLRAIVSRVIEIPREPEHLPDDDAGRAYKRGWQSVRALVDKALLPEEGQG
ncbi:hypothetical protein [Nonomuraea bangladeshensis]|uniref:hypothetical protein n=1 Tax=Nonomuraea bangladeshensis TaxID=404385 RepID=UPI003C2B72BB